MYARQKDNLKNIMIETIRESNNEEKREVFKKLDASYKTFKHIGRKAADEEKRTPLIIATQVQNRWAVEWLVQKNPLIHHIDDAKKNALLYSVQYEDKAVDDQKIDDKKNNIETRRIITRLLLEKSSALGDFEFYQDNDPKKYFEQNVIFQAASFKNYNFLNYFFKHENVSSWVWGLHAEFFEKLFFWGIEQGNNELLKCLYEIGFSDRRYQIRNANFLGIALTHNQIETAIWLINSGCSTPKDSYYYENRCLTPLERAAELGDLNFLRVLFDKTIKQPVDTSAIILASQHGHIEAVKLMLENSVINQSIDIKKIKPASTAKQENVIRVLNYLNALHFIWNNHELDAKEKAKKLLTEMDPNDRNHLLKLAEQYKAPQIIIKELKEHVKSLTDILQPQHLLELKGSSPVIETFATAFLESADEYKPSTTGPAFFSSRTTVSDKHNAALVNDQLRSLLAVDEYWHDAKELRDRLLDHVEKKQNRVLSVRKG